MVLLLVVVRNFEISSQKDSSVYAHTHTIYQVPRGGPRRSAPISSNSALLWWNTDATLYSAIISTVEQDFHDGSLWFQHGIHGGSSSKGTRKRYPE